MSSVIINTSYDVSAVACGHSVLYHMFHNPFCENQSLLVRVANIVFHVLTLGIPLMIYKILECCCPSVCGIKRPTSLFQKRVIADLSDIEQEAIKRGNELLVSDEEKLAECKSRKDFYFPISQDIQDMMKLSRMYSNETFKLVKTRDPKTIWTDQDDKELLDCADKFMNITLAAFIRSLEDLDGFMVAYNFTSAMEALTACCQFNPREKVSKKKDQNSYMFLIFKDMVTFYHNIRSGIRYNSVDKVFQVDVPASSEKSQLFYQDGFIHNKWRLMFNSFSKRLRMYIDEEELESTHNAKFHLLSIADENSKSYKNYDIIL